MSRGEWTMTAILLLGSLMVIVGVLAGCGSAPAQVGAQLPEQSHARVGVRAPVPSVEALIVAPDSTAGGYVRDARFGKGWRSIGQGCDRRDQIMAQDMTSVQYRTGSTCDVTAGVLYGVPLPASQVQIDHVIPLRLAWASGAWRWTDAQRRDFAQDPGELRAERGSSNESDGAAGPERSDPGSDRCAYAIRYVLTAQKYKLTVTQPRKIALKNLLATCGSR